MLNFIVCEDDGVFRKEIIEQIDNFMMNSDLEYKIHPFRSYGPEFEEIAKAKIGFKIFFFDIKTEYGSGIDAARYIREELNDWNALIVIITAFSEYQYEALSARLFLFDFINKLDQCNAKIQDDLTRMLRYYGNLGNCLSFEYNYVFRKIEFRDIIYIEKEQDSKRCIVHATYGDYKIPKTLAEVEKLLPKRQFMKVYRSVIVNVDLIHVYDIKNNFLDFANGIRIHSISRDKKKVLAERFGRVKDEEKEKERAVF